MANEEGKSDARVTPIAEMRDQERGGIGGAGDTLELATPRSRPQRIQRYSTHCSEHCSAC